jgi:hypothetical protein
MATKGTPRDTAQSSQEAEIAAGTSALADLTRQQMATSASTASALLRAMDTFQQTQLHMIQRAALLQEQTADRLRNANSPIELLAVQSTVMLSSMSEWAQYTQELMLASLKAQGEFMRPSEQQQSVSQAASAAAPLFQAWQSVFTAPLNGAMTASARHH